MPGAGNPQSWNRFAYVNNSPINFIDPTGHYIVQPRDDGHDVCPTPEDCVYPENWSDTNKRGDIIVRDKDNENGNGTPKNWDLLAYWLANKYFPAQADGSQVSFTGFIGAFRQGGLVERNFVMTANGQYQWYDTDYIDGIVGPQAGYTVSGGPIYGAAFVQRGTAAYEGGAVQVFGGTSVVGNLGVGGDGWSSVDDDYSLFDVSGYDVSVGQGVGLGVGAIGTYAKPITEPKIMSGRMLLICRILNGCGR